MEQVKNYYKRFVKEGFDKNGILNKFEIDCPDNFNFGYDIIDKFGEIDPDRKALIHIDLQENRHDFLIHSCQSCRPGQLIFLLHTVSKRAIP